MAVASSSPSGAHAEATIGLPNAAPFLVQLPSHGSRCPMPVEEWRLVALYLPKSNAMRTKWGHTKRHDGHMRICLLCHA